MLFNNPRKNRFNKDALLLCILPSLAVLVAMVAVSVWVWATAKQDYVRDRETLVSQHVNNIQGTLTNRLAAYEEILRGTAALFETSQTITAQDLHSIIASFDVQNRFPGVRAIGYAPVVTNDKLPIYLNYIRSSQKSDFVLFPDGEREKYIPIQYIEPQNEVNDNAVGFDMYSDDQRTASFDLAARKGTVVITGKVIPRSGATVTGGAAFQMYFPVYSSSCTGSAEQRSSCQLVGFVFAGFRADELVSSIASSNPTIKDGFAVYDGDQLTDTTKLFATEGFNQLAASSVAKMQLYSRTWTLAVQVPNSAYSKEIRSRPNLILSAGIVLSLSSSALIYILLLGRVRSLRIAKDSEVQMVKDDLLALAAHQLRTPATAVKQYLIMAVEGYGGELNKDQKSLVQKAYDNNERQLRTVNEMLYVANADAGKLRLIPRSVDLVQLVREAAEEQRSASNEHRHELKLHLPSTPLYYDADELYLRMAISNIVSNAIKYTPEAGKIEVSLKITPKNINIKISDNGVGISKKQMPDLFKKFSRLDNPLSTHAMGNGLGLYLARRVVELHKGRIKVMSEHTIGSEFTIILPRPKAEEQEPHTTKVTKSQE